VTDIMQKKVALHKTHLSQEGRWCLLQASTLPYILRCTLTNCSWRLAMMTDTAVHPCRGEVQQ
jgi:hypothetical protein